MYQCISPSQRPRVWWQPPPFGLVRGEPLRVPLQLTPVPPTPPQIGSPLQLTVPSPTDVAPPWYADGIAQDVSSLVVVLSGMRSQRWNRHLPVYRFKTVYSRLLLVYATL